MEPRCFGDPAAAADDNDDADGEVLDLVLRGASSQAGAQQGHPRRRSAPGAVSGRRDNVFWFVYWVFNVNEIRRTKHISLLSREELSASHRSKGATSFKTREEVKVLRGD